MRQGGGKPPHSEDGLYASHAMIIDRVSLLPFDEPDDALIVDASQSPETIVQQVRAALHT